MFEHVRQLLLNQKVTEAVTYLWKICTKLKETPDMENFSTAAKEECLFAFLLKIFIDSEDKSADNVENVNDAQKPEKDEKIKLEIIKRKYVVNYVKVRNVQIDINDILEPFIVTHFTSFRIVSCSPPN